MYGFVTRLNQNYFFFYKDFECLNLKTLSKVHWGNPEVPYIVTESSFSSAGILHVWLDKILAMFKYTADLT